MKSFQGVKLMPSGKCDLFGCDNKRITVTMNMFHDDGRLRKHVRCCSLAHAATFCLAYADREKANWDESVPTQETINMIETLIEQMMDDPDLFMVDKDD